MIKARNALILNFTANLYHWGCYGTAMEIYQSLLERGYFPSFLSVQFTHSFAPSPATPEQMHDRLFMQQALTANPALASLMQEADIIIVNGEGTLHRTHPGPKNLLFLMNMARDYFDKPVYLINHSFYPSGTRQPETAADTLYSSVATKLTGIVPREIYSREILQRLAIKTHQGFDCLPRFIARYRQQLAPRDVSDSTLVLSGGVNMQEDVVRHISRIVGLCRAAGQKLVYLTGAKSFPAAEDVKIYQWMRNVLPDLEFYAATSAQDWLNRLGSARGLISGRFHHSLAAATLGTPIIAFPSNTPKLDAVCDMMGLSAPIASGDLPLLEEKVAQDLEAINAGNGVVMTEAARDKILMLAEVNFRGL